MLEALLWMLWQICRSGRVVVAPCATTRAQEVPERTCVDVRNSTLKFILLPDSPTCDARLVVDFFARYLLSVKYDIVPFTDPPLLPDQPVKEYELWSMVNR